MADVGLNQQTLNIYDLIRVQDDAFRALGRAFYSGRPGPSPLVYPALSYDNPTESEQEMLTAMEAAMDAQLNPDAPDFYKLLPMEVSGLARMCCDLGHFIQSLTQRNSLTDGTKAQQLLQQINGHAGNIEAVARKMMCLVDPQKSKACFPLSTPGTTSGASLRPSFTSSTPLRPTSAQPATAREAPA